MPSLSKSFFPMIIIKAEGFSMGNKRSESEYTVPTKYWHAIESNRIQCDVCPRNCKLHEGQRGLCFVRACQDQKIVLTTYGRSSGYCIDPIEKKPLNHFLPGTPVLSFGTAGCNLACKFCQNWDISKSREIDALNDEASPEKIAYVAEKLSCKSIAFTYNDPVIFMEYAIAVSKACHQRNIKTVAVTAGYMNPEPRKEFYQYIDAANVDLKAFSEDFYVKITGGHLQPVLDTLIYLKKETAVWFEITTLLIPEKNDSPQEIKAMCQWIANNLGVDVPLHFSAFHPDWKMRDIPNTPSETLLRARKIALEQGLQFVYTGNIHDTQSQSTYCPHCHQLVIERNWYVLGKYALSRQGDCLFCGKKIAGVFHGKAGDWGAKRQLVNLKSMR
jgi:pyruvate formate lyase activating enzyme